MATDGRTYRVTVAQHTGRSSRWARRLGQVVAAAAIAIGLMIVMIAGTLGRCDAFGGRCPADPPPLWDDDVFGMAAFGTALAVGVATFVRRPTRRRAVRSVGWATVAGVIVGLIVRAAAHG